MCLLNCSTGQVRGQWANEAACVEKRKTPLGGWPSTNQMCSNLNKELKRFSGWGLNVFGTIPVVTGLLVCPAPKKTALRSGEKI